jgi:hypothetical protein
MNSQPEEMCVCGDKEIDHYHKYGCIRCECMQYIRQPSLKEVMDAEAVSAPENKTHMVCDPCGALRDSDELCAPYDGRKLFSHGQPEVSSERIHEIIHEHREALDMLGEADHGQPSMTDHNEPPLPNYCAFCETELFGDNDADMLREHLKVCDKHPMKALLSLAERMNDAAIYHLEMHNPVSNIILRQRIAEFEAWKEKGK